ncbi:MAG: DUF222 domain-containing protein, partial [Gemmatimonadota bacterium]
MGVTAGAWGGKAGAERSRDAYARRASSERRLWVVREVAVEDDAVDPEDELFLLGERCAETYMRADALQYEAMVLLAEFDERDGWQDTGFGGTAEWLAWRIGIKPGAARERVRTARALGELPLTSAAMRDGELSFTKVRALTRVARAESEEALLEFARSCSAARLEAKLRGWTTDSVLAEADAEARRHLTRTFSVFPDDDGMYVVRGRLDPEVGAALMRAIEAASDALFRGEPPPGADEDETMPEQRRADAVGLVAERALAAGFGDGPLSGSRAERYQVVLHVEEAALRETATTTGLVAAPKALTHAAMPTAHVSAETSGPRSTVDPGQVVRADGPTPRPVSELADGVRVSAETSRRLACDASVVRVTRELDVGRRTRTVPPSLRRALEARDRGCRFPGCGGRFTDAHHVEHWADGGETRLENLVLLCRRHHRAVHEGRTRVCRGADDSVVFFAPRGRTLYDAPKRSLNGHRPAR